MNNLRLNELKNMRHKKMFAVLFLTVLLSFCTTTVEAQNNWGLTFRPSANFPIKDLGDAKLKPGLGLEGAIDYKFLQNFAIYAGWGWNKFSADQSFAGSNIDFAETGYRYGLSILQPIGNTKLKYSIAAGGLYNHIEVENTNGEIISNSGHGIGWEVEAGILIPIVKQFSLIPTVRYHSLSREIKINNIATSVILNYLSVGAGLNWSF
jgi:hypothetical protein